MKKRKIFVGLLLGAAAFGLAACTTGGNSTTSGENTPSTTQGVTPTTSNTTPSGDPTPTTPTTPTAQKYTVKYYAVVGDDDATEVTAAAQEVEEGKTTTAPEAKLAKDGYKIVGYYTNEGCGEEFKFTTTITKNTKVYVKYVELSKYDELATSTNKVVAYDFNTATTVTKVSTLEFDSTTNEVSIKTNSDAIKVSNDVLTFGDVDGNALIDFGKKLESSAIYSVYYEMTFRDVQSQAGSIAQLNGTTGSDYTNVFELRNNKGKLAYNAEGKGNTDSALTITANSTIKVLIELDTADGKLTVDVNGTKIYDAQTNITGINGIKFQQAISKTKFDVDNVAVAFKEKAASGLTVAKTDAKDTIDTFMATTTYTNLGETAGPTSANAAIKKLIDDTASKAVSDINAATTEAAVATIKANWETFVAAEKPVVTITPYTAADTVYTAGGNYYIAVVSGSTVDLTSVSFAGANVDKYYTGADLATEYSASAITTATTICAKVSVAVKTVMTFASTTINSSNDGDQTNLGNNFVYVAKKGAALKDVAAKNISIEGTPVTKAINTGGKSDANKNFVKIDLSSLATTSKKKVTVYLAGGGSGDRSGYFSTTKDGLTGGAPSSTQIVSGSSAIKSTDGAVVNGNATLTGGATYYFVFDNSIHIYGFVIEDVE